MASKGSGSAGGVAGKPARSSPGAVRARTGQRSGCARYSAMRSITAWPYRRNVSGSMSPGGGGSGGVVGRPDGSGEFGGVSGSAPFIRRILLRSGRGACRASRRSTRRRRKLRGLGGRRLPESGHAEEQVHDGGHGAAEVRGGHGLVRTGLDGRPGGGRVI